MSKYVYYVLVFQLAKREFILVVKKKRSTTQTEKYYVSILCVCGEKKGLYNNFSSSSSSFYKYKVFFFVETFKYLFYNENRMEILCFIVHFSLSLSLFIKLELIIGTQHKFFEARSPFHSFDSVCICIESE